MKELLSLLNFDTKTQEGITNITVWLAIITYFLFINVFVVPINVPKQPSDYTLYLFVLFVPSAVRLIFFSGDPISFKKNREAIFFQSQFPDAHIAKKFGIDKPLAQHIWFKALDKRESEGEIRRTFQYGFTCRLVYYVRRLTVAFAGLAVVLLLANAAWIYWQRHHSWVGFAPIVTSFAAITRLKAKVFYILNLLAIPVYIWFENRPKMGAPTGVWARWKQINDRNKAWLDQFTSLEELQNYVGEGPTGQPRDRHHID